MGIGESIKKGFAVAQKSFPLVAVLFVVGFAWNLVNIFYSSRLQTGSRAASGIAIAIGLVFVLVTVFLQGGSLGYIRDRVKTGQATLGAFLSSGSKYYGRLLLIAIVVALVIAVYVLVAALIISLLGDRAVVVAVGLALVIAGIGIYSVILLFFAPYLAIAGEQKAITALKNSVKLVRTNLLKLLGISLLLIVIGFAAGLVLGLIFVGLSFVLKGSPAQAVFAFLSSLINSYLGVIVSGAFMSFYLSLPNNNTEGAN